jgi:hypothetical protein
MPKAKPKTVDEYIAAAPGEAQEKLREICAVLSESALGCLLRPCAGSAKSGNHAINARERKMIELLIHCANNGMVLCHFGSVSGRA